LSIALAPYTPVFTERKWLKAAELGIPIHRGAEIILLPSVSAFVGADIVAGLASVKIPSQKNILFIDIGTNGEIVLVTRRKILCCAAAAGPAFEGANITCGTGAFEGAVSAFVDCRYSTIANSTPSGICGSGLVDIIAYLLDAGIINNEGYMKEDFIVVPAGKTVSGNPVILTFSDVREVQLAKSAILSGIRILLKSAEMQPHDIHGVYIAGGFGNYIRTENALKIGLFPKEFENKIITLGNTSGTGAMLSLKSIHFDNYINEILERMEYIELSLNEDFPQEFAINMYF